MLHAVGTVRTPDLEATLGAHIAGVRFEDLPRAAVDAARRTLIWHVGNALAGSAAPGSDAILRYCGSQGSGSEATVLGTRERLPATMAAFANACFGKAHEYEDKYWLDAAGGFAIGFAVAPAALALAEAGGRSGRDVLTAIAVAVDLQARLLSAIRDELSPSFTGFNSTYTFANFGTATAAAKVLGLNASQVVDALGLVHAQVAGNFQGQLEGVLGIRLQAGFSTRNGIAAAQLAAMGVGGARQALSGRFGLYRLYYPDRRVDMDSLTDGLGRRWLGERLGYKGYP
jgi:2-methylcitrate dehydratase PrpD